jgi:DNA-binding winged helix-turn-helix (wHTH) protein
MVIKRSSRQVTFDRRPILMSSRSVDVLIVLAEALIEGSGPVSTTKLKQMLFAEITADNAVAVAKNALRKSLGTDKDRSLVQTRGRLGYFLQLEPNEIIILP